MKKKKMLETEGVVIAIWKKNGVGGEKKTAGQTVRRGRGTR